MFLGLSAFYLLLLGVAYAGQRRLMYFPDRQRQSPQSLGLAGVEELQIPAPDGTHVVAWHAAARSHSKGRKACRSSGPGSDKVRAAGQP